MDVTAVEPPPVIRHKRRRRVAVFAIGICVVGASVVAAWITSRHSGPNTKALPKPSPVVHVLPTYEVAVGGTGDCVHSPCGTLSAAIARIISNRADGAIVEIASGQYGDQKLKHSVVTDAFSHNVVFEPMSGAHVTLASMVLNTAHVTIRNIVLAGTAKMGATAVYSGFDHISTQHGSAMLAASNSFLTNSVIVPSVDSDGIDIKAYGGQNPQHITVEHNVVGPTYRGPKRTHVDCLQILGGSDMTIRYNRFFHCADQGIIVGSGASGTVSGMLDIEQNEIQLCPQRTADCDGFDAISIKAPTVQFIHNTVIDGGTVFSVENLTVAGNYIENLKTCDGRVQANLIGSTRCALSADNRLGTPQFVDRHASPPNLTPMRTAGLPGAAQWIMPPFSAADINGVVVNPSDATPGAVQIAAGVTMPKLAPPGASR